MIRIITDSSSDLSLEYCKANDVAIIPMRVSFGSESFYDGVDITSSEFYDRLEKSDQLPTTSLIGPERFVEEFNKYPDDEIICLLITAGLSGTTQAANIAIEEVGRSDIKVIETGQTAVGLAIIVEYAVSLIKKGLDYQELIKTLEEDIPRVEILGIINTFKYLVKGGRLSKISGTVGSVLSIKPIIQCFDGVLKNVDKARGFKAASKNVAQTVRDNYDPDLPIKFIYSKDDKNLNILKNELSEIDCGTMTLGPIVGTHIGPNCAGISYFNKKKSQ